MAETLAKRIRLPNAHMVAGAKGARWHMVAAKYPELRPGTKVDLLMSLHFSGTLEPVFSLVVADQDKNFRQKAKRDLARILKVKLPSEQMNQGAESGRRLRELRAQTLAKNSKL